MSRLPDPARSDYALQNTARLPRPGSSKPGAGLLHWDLTCWRSIERAKAPGKGKMALVLPDTINCALAGALALSVVNVMARSGPVFLI